MPQEGGAKKKLSPYMKFCKKTRPKIIKEKANLSFTEIGKELGNRWRALSEAEKAKFA